MSSSLFDLTGMRALVTGSGQGIGLALAEGLGRRRRRNRAERAQRREKVAAAAGALAAKGHNCVAVFDVTDHAAVVKGVAEIETKVGAIDILINNAGMQFRMPLEDFPADKWDELLRTNISSVFFVGQAVARGIAARKRHSTGRRRRWVSRSELARRTNITACPGRRRRSRTT